MHNIATFLENILYYFKPRPFRKSSLIDAVRLLYKLHWQFYLIFKSIIFAWSLKMFSNDSRIYIVLRNHAEFISISLDESDTVSKISL